MLLDRIRTYLSPLQRGPRAVPIALRIEPGIITRTFFEALSSLPPEHADAPDSVQSWTPEQRTLFGDVFLWTLESLGWTPSMAMVHGVLVCGFSGRRGEPLRFDGIHPSLLKEAWSAASYAARWLKPFWSDLHLAPLFEGSYPARYCEELMLVTPQAGRHQLTPAGRLFLRLKGSDVQRWLLTLEMELSTGDEDVWRMSRGLGRLLLNTPKGYRIVNPGIPTEASLLEDAASLRTLRRLAALELVKLTYDEEPPESGIDLDYWVYDTPQSTLGHLKELIADQLSVLELTAASILSELRGDILEEYGAPQSSHQYDDPFPQLIAHEIGNSLVPVEGFFKLICDEVSQGRGEEAIADFGEDVTKGLRRAIDFTRDLARKTELSIKQDEHFRVMDAINEAIAQREVPTNISLTQESAPDTHPLVKGQRLHFILATLNILQNAYRAIGALEGRVNVEILCSNSKVILHIDDSGPGVPEFQRLEIFNQGFSLTGSSGDGLALAKQVVQDSMDGIIRCEESPLGGARFTIKIPRAGESEDV